MYINYSLNHFALTIVTYIGFGPEGEIDVKFYENVNLQSFGNYRVNLELPFHKILLSYKIQL